MANPETEPVQKHTERASAFWLILAGYAVYFAFMIPALDRHSLENDDICYSLSAYSLFQHGVFSWSAVHLTGFDTSKPMIDTCVLTDILAVPAVALGGYSFYSLKATAILAGVLALLGVAVVGQRLSGRLHYAALSVLLLAGSFLFQTSCRFIRPHLMIGLLLPWGLLLLIRGLEQNSRRHLFGAGMIGAGLGLAYAPVGLLPFLLTLSFLPLRSGGASRWRFILTQIGPLLLGYGLVGILYGLAIFEVMGWERYLGWLHVRVVGVGLTYKPGDMARYFSAFFNALPPRELLLLSPLVFVLVWLWRSAPSPKPKAAQILARTLLIAFLLLMVVWPRKGFHEVAIVHLIPAVLLFASLAKSLPLGAFRLRFSPTGRVWIGVSVFLAMNVGASAYKLSVKLPQAGFGQMIQTPLRKLLASASLPPGRAYPIYGPNLLLPVFADRDFRLQYGFWMDQALTGTPQLELFNRETPLVWIDSLSRRNAAAPLIDASGCLQDAVYTDPMLTDICTYCQTHGRFLGAIPYRQHNQDHLLRVFWVGATQAESHP